MAVGNSPAIVAVGHVGIGFHVKAAAQAGATRQQLSEALGMAIYMEAGPSVMYANHALAAFDQFKQTRA